jgi:hypothetical protein
MKTKLLKTLRSEVPVSPEFYKDFEPVRRSEVIHLQWHMIEHYFLFKFLSYVKRKPKH